jgi:hypothetical protein
MAAVIITEYHCFSYVYNFIHHSSLNVNSLCGRNCRSAIYKASRKHYSLWRRVLVYDTLFAFGIGHSWEA